MSSVHPPIHFKWSPPNTRTQNLTAVCVSSYSVRISAVYALVENLFGNPGLNSPIFLLLPGKLLLRFT